MTPEISDGGGLKFASVTKGSVASDATQRAARYLEAQFAVNLVLMEASPLREVMTKLLGALGEAMSWGAGIFWTPNPDGHVLGCQNLWSSPGTIAAEFESSVRQTSLPIGAGLPGCAWEKGQIQWTACAADDASLPYVAMAAQSNLRGALAFPVRLQNEFLGIFEFFGREVREPDELQRRLLEGIGYQIFHFVESRRVERDLRETAERYRLILENALEYAIFTADRHGRVTTWNSGAQRILGHEEAEILGQPLDIIFTPDDRSAGQLDLEMRLALEQGRARDERWHLRKDGSRFWASGLMMPLKGDDDQHLGFLKILRDRTNKRRSEEALQASEARFRHLADSMPQIVWIARPDGSIEYFNRRWFEFNGTANAPVVDQTWAAVLSSGDLARWSTTWSTATESGELFQIECRFQSRASGSARWFLARALAIRDEEGRIVRWYGTCTDIDEQKRGEERFVRLNQTLLSLLEAFPDVVFVIGVDGSIHFKNPAAGRFARAVGMHGQLPPPVQREVEQVLKTGEDHFPTSLKTVHRFELDQEERYFLNRVAGMRTPDNLLFGVVVMMQDVTDLRLLDEIKTNLISTVSHELKTPLTSIRTALSLLREQSVGHLNPQQAEMVGIASDESERLLRTLETLLDLTRFEEGAVGMRKEKVTPAQLIQAALEETQGAAAKARIRIKLELEDGLPELEVDQERIAHVFSNLLGNAIKYSPEDSEIVLRGRVFPGPSVYFGIVDCGSGVPAEYQSRIFERFFRVPGTSKKGAGLGLSIAREFVRAHRGRIGVYSDAGKGSEFFFILPTQ